MVKVKLTKGRQKIEIKPIASEEARQVCFSKRRPSLFKKASELSTLCGAKVAVVVFSPGGKLFSFGHPSVYSIVDHFIAMHTSDGHATAYNSHGTNSMSDTNNHELHQQLMELEQSLEIEKKRKENVQHALQKESGGHVLQCLPGEDEMLHLGDLKKFQHVLIAVQNMVEEKVSQMLQDAKKTRRPPPQPHMDVTLDSKNKFGEGQVHPHHISI